MYSARGKTWRSRLFDAPARPAARAPESPVATGVGPAAPSLPRILLLLYSGLKRLQDRNQFGQILHPKR